MKLLHILIVAMLFAGCNNSVKKSANIANNKLDFDTSPVEKKKPNRNNTPAFAGQTRVHRIFTTTPIEFKIISESLDRPWGIAVLPDGKLLITEKPGTMRIADSSGKLSAAITGIPSVVNDGQGGLLGLTIDPDFASNRMVYWCFTEKYKDGNLTSVAKGKLSADESKIENAQVIYRAIPAYDGDKHFGGRIIFDGGGNLFVSTGERSDRVTRPQAQQLNSALGKILHITKEGKPVATNPFLHTNGALPEIYTYGHRNVQSLAIHPATGALWQAEFGPQGGDELNLIAPGKNYGWPIITYGEEYSGSTIGQGITAKEGMEQPVYYWDPVISPSGMTFYKSSNVPEWKNNLFIGCLSGQHICRLVIENDRVAGEERLLESENERFRDIAEGKDGFLYAVTDGGKLYKVGKR